MQYSENDFINFCKNYLKEYNTHNHDIYSFYLIDLKPKCMNKSEYENFLNQFVKWNKTANTKKFYFFEHGSQQLTAKRGLTIFNGNNTMMYCYMGHAKR